jgi:hypothetical protein
MIKTKSRAERNKEVRRILAQCSIDIQQISLAVNPNSVDLSGVLVKYDGSELNNGEVVNLVQALLPFGFLTTTLSNWNLTSGEITKIGIRK